jgi:hypothetical protein
MSINVSVPLDALENPEVARALSDLMLSLGGVSPTRQVVRYEAQPDVDEDLPPTPRRRRRPAPAAATQPSAVAAPSPPPARPARAPLAEAPMTEDERYHDFVDNLPDPSRQFLDLIRKHGNLRLSQAVRELGITRPKTLGGITGSLTRWAKQRGIDLPYRAGKAADGERVWTWSRGSEGNAATGRRARAPRRTSGGRGSDNKGKESEPASTQTQHDQPPPPDNLAELRPDVTGLGLLEDDRYAPLLEGMTDTARRFLVALSERGSLTMTEALDAVERKRAKSVGDAVRAFLFRAREQSLTLPFEERASHGGERMWLWKGLVPRTEIDGTRTERGSVIVIRGGRGDKARSAS